MPSAITDEELATCRQAFAQFDLDRSGSINLEELKIGFDKMTKQKNITRKTLKYLIEMFDITGDNELQFFELVFLMKSKEWEMIMNSDSTSRFSISSYDGKPEETKNEDAFSSQSQRITLTPRTFEAKRSEYTGEKFANNKQKANTSIACSTFDTGDKENIMPNQNSSCGKKRPCFFFEEEKEQSCDDDVPKQTPTIKHQEEENVQTFATIPSETTKSLAGETQEDKPELTSFSVRNNIAFFQGNHGKIPFHLSEEKQSFYDEENNKRDSISVNTGGGQYNKHSTRFSEEKLRSHDEEDIHRHSKSNINEGWPTQKTYLSKEKQSSDNEEDKRCSTSEISEVSADSRNTEQRASFSQYKTFEAPLQANDFLFPLCLDETLSECSDTKRSQNIGRTENFSQRSTSDNPRQSYDFLTPVCIREEVAAFKHQFSRIPKSEKALFLQAIANAFPLNCEEEEDSENGEAEKNDQVVRAVSEDGWISFQNDESGSSFSFCFDDQQQRQNDDRNNHSSEEFSSLSRAVTKALQAGNTIRKNPSKQETSLNETDKNIVEHHWTDDLDSYAALPEESSENCVIQLEAYNHHPVESSEISLRRVMQQPFVALKGVKRLLGSFPKKGKVSSNTTTAYSRMHDPQSCPHQLYEC